MSKDLNVKTGKTKIPYGCLNKTRLLLWFEHQMSVWNKAMAVGMWKERKSRLVGEGEAINWWWYWQGWWLTGCKTVWKVGRSSKKKKKVTFSLLEYNEGTPRSLWPAGKSLCLFQSLIQTLVPWWDVHKAPQFEINFPQLQTHSSLFWLIFAWAKWLTYLNIRFLRHFQLRLAWKIWIYDNGFISNT